MGIIDDGNIAIDQITTATGVLKLLRAQYHYGDFSKPEIDFFEKMLKAQYQRDLRLGIDKALRKHKTSPSFLVMSNPDDLPKIAILPNVYAALTVLQTQERPLNVIANDILEDYLARGIF